MFFAAHAIQRMLQVLVVRSDQDGWVMRILKVVCAAAIVVVGILLGVMKTYYIFNH